MVRYSPDRLQGGGQSKYVKRAHLAGLVLHPDAPLQKLIVSNNYMENTNAVSGKAIVWDEPNFIFEPQKQIVRSLTDIAVINRIITTNKPTGMTQAPADGSSIPADWTGKVIWNTAVPRQVKEINLYDTGMSGVLNVSNLTALERLSCHKNNLTGLTLDNLPALIDLNCRENQLTGMLDVTHLSKLTGFSCRINQLTGLNVSGLTNLEHLNCSENNLSELLVNSLTALKSLYCDSNDLVSLDVSGRNALTELNCSKNQLTELALHPDAAFKKLIVSYNYMKDESMVSGRQIVWNAPSFVFAPQYRRITFMANGGDGEMVDGRAVDQEDFELPANGFKAPLGKYFQAWAIGSKDGQQLNAGDRHTFTADTPVYAIWADAPNKIEFFRAGDKEMYTVGETITLDARAVDGTAPYDYQFYANRSKGSEVILRDYAAANAFDWRPQDPDTYTVGVRAMDAEGIVVSQEKTLTVLVSTVEPLHIVTFRAGWSDTYELGQTINLAARGGGGTGPYKYQFYVLRSNGNRVNFRPAPVSANIYPWTPVTPDTYTLGVDVYDATGKKVNEEKRITVLRPDAPPLTIAAFRAGWSDTYKLGQTIDLAARGEGGTGPYKYQFYVLRSNGSRVNFRATPVSSNIYPWTPVTPDTYTLGFDVYDATGKKVNEEKRITVLKPDAPPLTIAVFRAGWSDTYKLGQTINLAARGEGGTGSYKYQFYVLRSNGSRVNFRKTPVSSNIYPWTPVAPDTYTLGVDVYDSSGKKVTQTKTITVLP